MNRRPRNSDCPEDKKRRPPLFGRPSFLLLTRLFFFTGRRYGSALRRDRKSLRELRRLILLVLCFEFRKLFLVDHDLASCFHTTADSRQVIGKNTAFFLKEHLFGKTVPLGCKFLGTGLLPTVHTDHIPVVSNLKRIRHAVLLSLRRWRLRAPLKLWP